MKISRIVAILILLCFFLSSRVKAQDTLTYFTKKEVIGKEVRHILISESEDTAIVTPFVSVKEPDKTKVRRCNVILNNKSYFIYQEPKNDLYQIRDQNENVLASVGLTKDTFFDVTLPDGTKYDFQGGITSSSWGYASNKGDTVLCWYEKRQGGKYLVYIIEGPNREGIELLKVVAHIHGVNLIADKKKRTILYGVAAVLGVVVVAGGQ